jgi:hypothetical protein
MGNEATNLLLQCFVVDVVEYDLVSRSYEDVLTAGGHHSPIF